MGAVGRALLLLVLPAIFWLACSPAFAAEKRVALIIGNSAYQNVGRLANPAHDAEVMAATLKGAGFEVVDLKQNLKVAEMRRALRDFSDNARDADVAVVYYAGHGMEIDGTNYLIPVDAVLERDIDAYDEAVPLERVLTVVEPATKVRLIILDACRDNPFGKTMKRTIGSRAVGRGLAKVEPSNPNTLIAYASKAGSTASDGDSKNSPFTAALVKHIITPGLDLRKAFGYVRDDVLKSTGNKQEPFVYGSLGGDDVPLVPSAPVAAGPQPNPQDTIRRDYELALQLGTRDGWSAFLAQYPDGFYANLAKGQLNKIAAEEARAAAAEKARLAEQDRARLAAEGARQAEQAKAALAAKAAEDAQVAAEKAKQIEQAKAAAAEQARAAAEKAAADKLAADKLAAEKGVADTAARIEQKDGSQRVASFSPSSDKPDQSTATDLPRLLQSELRRVGCNTGAVDSNWNAEAQHALGLFNKHAGTKLDVKLASADALDVVKSRTSRVCPLACDHGFRADGDRCVKITCRAGYRVNDDDECEKLQEKKPVATREEPQVKRESPERKQAEPGASKPQASGQMFCGAGGCRPVKKGCRLIELHRFSTNMSGGVAEACN